MLFGLASRFRLERAGFLSEAKVAIDYSMFLLIMRQHFRELAIMVAKITRNTEHTVCVTAMKTPLEHSEIPVHQFLTSLKK